MGHDMALKGRKRPLSVIPSSGAIECRRAARLPRRPEHVGFNPQRNHSPRIHHQGWPGAGSGQSCRDVLEQRRGRAAGSRPAGKEIRLGDCRTGQPCDQSDPARVRKMREVQGGGLRQRPSRQGEQAGAALRREPKEYLQLSELRHDSGQSGSRHHLYRPAERDARRIHGSRTPGRQACALGKAHGQYACGVPANDRRRTQGQSKTHGGVPLPL